MKEIDGQVVEYSDPILTVLSHGTPINEKQLLQLLPFYIERWQMGEVNAPWDFLC